MTTAPAPEVLDELLARRTTANRAYFESEAPALARLCHEMARRFERGGRLLACGRGPADRSDARHVAVEFVHPVIVGKRALPALAVETAGDVALLAEPDDILMGFGVRLEAPGALSVSFDPPGDAFVRQELAETAYHVLWELVHVFFEHRARPVHDPGASAFLYPFLGGGETDLDAVLADVERSVLMKAAEVAALREQTLREPALAVAAEALRASFAAGGRLLALGNGGSSTDAMDVVADLRAAGRPAIDLSDDAGILTAIANDVGVEAMFSRQVIAHGRAGDVLLAISTSGGSGNVLHALAEARRRGLATIALVGYDGGRIAAEGLADVVIVTRSENIPRIQEAQASAYHALVELMGRA